MENERNKMDDSEYRPKNMSSLVHTAPEFKEARKAFQGINSTPKKAIDKSIARNRAKAVGKALENYKK